jgi:hypothetical protein
MDRDLFVLLWTDDGEPQCALYEDFEMADRDADLVGGHIELRAIHRSPNSERTGRFTRPTD